MTRIWRDKWIRRVETAEHSWKEVSAVLSASQGASPWAKAALCPVPGQEGMATVLVQAGGVDFLPAKPQEVLNEFLDLPIKLSSPTSFLSCSLPHLTAGDVVKPRQAQTETQEIPVKHKKKPHDFHR